MVQSEALSLVHRRVVLATGVFDLLHPGHVKFLEASKKKGGRGAKLFVVVARDKTVLKRKGRSPILSERQRVELVSSLKPVDKAFLGRKNIDMLGILKEVKPDIVSVGFDQQDIKNSLLKILKREGLRISVVQIRKFDGNGLNNSTKLKNRIAQRWTRSS